MKPSIDFLCFTIVMWSGGWRKQTIVTHGTGQSGNKAKTIHCDDGNLDLMLLHGVS